MTTIRHDAQEAEVWGRRITQIMIARKFKYLF